MTLLEKNQLIQQLANAVVTYAHCGGRHKADMNKEKAAIYEKKLIDAGAIIPNRDHLLKIGIFNAEGAW